MLIFVDVRDLKNYQWSQDPSSSLDAFPFDNAVAKPTHAKPMIPSRKRKKLHRKNVHAFSLLPSLNSFCRPISMCPPTVHVRVPYQGLHGSVQSVSVVSSELWIGTLERWISHGLWLLDTVCGPRVSAFPSPFFPSSIHQSCIRHREVGAGGRTNPFR